MREGKGGVDERRLNDRAKMKKEARAFSSQTASCPMRQRAMPALISSKAQSKRERERKGGRGRDSDEEENANLGRSSEAPANIGHWPIFSLRRKEDLL